MKNSYKIFQSEIEELVLLYNASIIAYEQTKNLKKAIKKNIINNDESIINSQIENFPNKISNIEYTLRELILVRLISAIEVYLINNVKFIFTETKEPFKKNGSIQFDQRELLSFKSLSELYNKIINKECRQLSSEGLEKIITYYNQRFNIDLASLMPSKSLILEYHDKRHLIVHRLGRTDKQFRDKYNSTKLGFSINHKYIVLAIENVCLFAENLMKNTIKFLDDTKQLKLPKEENTKEIIFSFQNNSDKEPVFLEHEFEFWSGDDLVFLKDILKSKIPLADNFIEVVVNGNPNKVRDYYKKCRKISKGDRKINFFQRKEDDNIYFSDQQGKWFKKTVTQGKISEQEIDIKPKVNITEELVIKITTLLPQQPWEVGIHKRIAKI